MKHFNLSAWAVSHPALILFLVVVLGAAGFFSYENLGRAEDPFFTVKVVNVSAIWPGATAAEMQMQVADPIEKKLQELPYFDKVQTYSKPAFTAMQVTFKDSTPPKDVPYLFYLLRKKLADVQPQLPANLLGPRRQRRILRRRFHPLYDDQRRRRLCAVEEGRRRHAPAAAEGAGRDQGRSLRHPGREDLRRILPRQAGDARDHAAGAVRFARQAEQCRARRYGRDFVATRAAARHRRAGRRQGRRRDAGRKQRQGVPAGRYRHRHPRLRRSAEFRGAPGRQARARHRRGHRQGRQHPGTWQGRRRRDRRLHEGGAAGHRCRTDRGPAGRGRARRQRVRAFLHRGAGHRAVRLLHRAGLAHRHRRGAVGAAGAGDRLHHHERDVARSAPHHARRADHRAGAPGRRRHHRGRDDGGEDGAGLGPRSRGVVCLGVHRVSDADGNAGDGCRLPPHRFCQFRGRRICRRHLLDRGDRAGGLLVRRGDLHPLYRCQAAAQHHAAAQPRSARGV